MKLKEKARGVKPHSALDAISARGMPVEVKSEFGGGLEQHKAIYRPFAQAVPDLT